MPVATNDEFELDIRLQEAGAPSAAYPPFSAHYNTCSCAFGCTD